MVELTGRLHYTAIKSMFKLTGNHLKLYEKVSKRGAGRICNDLNPDEVSLLTRKSWEDFTEAYHIWNGDPEEYFPGNWVMMDFMVIGFIRAILIDSYQKGLKNEK